MSGGVLSLIWTLALVLVASAFAVLGALIVARLRREALDRLDPDRRARISSALKQFAITGARPTIAVASTLDRQILVEVALSSAQLMRGAARGRLVQYLRDIGFDQKMRRQALRGTMRDRLAAIEALRLFPDQQTTSTLQRCESDRDLRISLAALHTRCEMGFGPDMLGLLEIAARPGAGRSPHMQDLVEARAAANLPEALRVLSGRLPDPARVLLIRAIGETGARAALGPLKVALHHPCPEVRAAAAGSLGALGSGEAAEALARATRDADWRVRLRAAEAIGRLGLWRQAQALEPLLEDDVWWVRFRAEEALQRLSGIALSHLNTAASALHSAAANDKLRSAPT